MRAPLIAMILLPLAACASTATPPITAEGSVCSNAALESFIGQQATAELGAALLKASGARTLRWGAPGMAMSMDFRPDRLTVSYDDAMLVTSARCG